jgi:chorismate dehydratase
MAAADWFSLEESFERVGALGIACRGEVGSVLLLGGAPVDSLSGGRVVLTTESSTSAALVRILLGRRFGLADVRYERGEFRDPRDIPAGEAWLVIGDSALAARRAAPASVMLDLGQAWAAWTGLPFVYAVWAVRRSLPVATREALASFLDEGLARGEADLTVPARSYFERSQGRLGTPEEMTRYLKRFTYRLGADEERGLSLFHTHWKELAA